MLQRKPVCTFMAMFGGVMTKYGTATSVGPFVVVSDHLGCQTVSVSAVKMSSH